MSSPSPNFSAISLNSPATIRGTGLFTARNATLTISPAAPGHGIVFRRVDLPDSPSIPDLLANVTTNAPLLPARNTTLIADPARPASPTNATIATVEHVLSALAGLGITDALIEIDGPEVPIGDGSALPFVTAIDEVGLAYSPDGGAPALVIDRLVAVPDPKAPLGTPAPCVTGEPHPTGGLWMSYELDYGPRGAIRASKVAFTIDPTTYRREIAPARTFCLRHEAEAMRRAGLFQHLTYQEMLVLDESGRPIDNELRFADEPARHKLLDLLGDLVPMGRRIRGRISAQRSGHALNHLAAVALLRAFKPDNSSAFGGWS